MPYADALAEKLNDDAAAVVQRMLQLLIPLARASSTDIPPRSREHLMQGAGRRLGILQHCVSSIFTRFPTSTTKPLARETLYDVQVAHHAFVINLYGYFENLAWAFVIRHGLEEEVGGRKKIGLFLKSTQLYLPRSIASYLTSPTIRNWHDTYLKNYRDSLAHRVPLYIPPSALTRDDVRDLDSLHERQRAAIGEHHWDLLEELRAEEHSLGQANLLFLHSHSDTEDARPIYLHPQIICDALTITDFTPIYLDAWHERA